MHLKLSPPRKRALMAARDQGGAWYGVGRRGGGAYARMCLAMVREGLLDGPAPFTISDHGLALIGPAPQAAE